jgi:hypothetical protein
MQTGRAIVTGVLHGCEHTYIAYVAGTISTAYIYAAHSGIDKAPVDPLGGGRLRATEKGSQPHNY